MTKSELIAQVAQDAQISKKDAEKIINTFYRVISETLKSKHRLSLHGLGIFNVIKRGDRKVRSPQSRKTITIHARDAVRFNAGMRLKNALLPGDPTTDAD